MIVVALSPVLWVAAPLLRLGPAFSSRARPIASVTVRVTPKAKLSRGISSEYRWKLASLLQRVRSLSGEEDEKKTFKAFRYAYRFHRTQFRQSGEPYITRAWCVDMRERPCGLALPLPSAIRVPAAACPCGPVLAATLRTAVQAPTRGGDDAG